MKFRRGPIWAVAAVVVAGVAGGSTVYLLGDRISAQDRADIVTFEATLAEAVADARARFLALPALVDEVGTDDARAALLATRMSFQSFRRALPEIRTARILYPTASSMTIWLDLATDALVVLEGAAIEARPPTTAERGRFADLFARADAVYRTGLEALVRLRCRARLDGCELSALPT